jgi:hypothetical protein
VNIKLPENMAVGLILPLSMIEMTGDAAGIGEGTPLLTMLEEVNWAEFFRQIDWRPRIDGDAETFLEDLRKHCLDSLEILDVLLDEDGLNLTGIIVRLDVVSINSEAYEDFSYYVWKNFYGYCETFAEVEGVIQSLTEKASQEVAV